MKYLLEEIIQDIKEVIKPYISDYVWIPVNEALPKENEYVRVTIWCGHEWIGIYRDGKWFVYGIEGLSEATVIAWQPTHPYQVKESM